MEVFETGKNNEQPAAKAEPIRSGDGLIPEEMYAKGMEKYNAGDFSDALVWFEKAAEQGDDKGQFYCGAMYHHGIGGTSEDMEKALMWYEKAAEQGNAEAQFWYGHIYYWGEGRLEDKEKALMWYKKAAEQGDASGQVMCGYMYRNGEGTTEDKEKALMWYRKAAEQGDALGQVRYGEMYYNGEGTTEDKAKALMWYEKAAEQGNRLGQFQCGEMYYNGEGTTEDKAKALMWYEKAADGYVGVGISVEPQLRARLRCFDMYRNGEGTTEDKEKALMWYKKAVEQGHDMIKSYDDELQRLQEELQKDKMTQSYYNKLQKYLYSCKTIETAKVRRIVDEARRLGDLPESEIYKVVKEAEHSLHRLIEGIEEILQAEPVRSGDGLTPEEMFAKGKEKYNAREFSDALMWYEKAAKQGDIVTQCECGDMYYKGEGTSENKAKALMWYEKAAEQGNAWAQFRCDDMYDKGEGTETDGAKAWRWYEKIGRRDPSDWKMTQFHYDELQKELEYCRTTRTIEVKKAVDEARRLGDLSENMEYHAAKEAERLLYYRIEKIEKILQQAYIV